MSEIDFGFYTTLKNHRMPLMIISLFALVVFSFIVEFQCQIERCSDFGLKSFYLIGLFGMNEFYQRRIKK